MASRGTPRDRSRAASLRPRGRQTPRPDDGAPSRKGGGGDHRLAEHRLAAERGRRGERYLLGGDNVDVASLARLVEQRTGKKPATSMPPEWVLRAVATVSEAVSRISRKPPMITRALLDDVAGGAPVFAIDKARRELGYEPRAAEDVVAATIDWAKRMKWVD